jgi:hypothetical protein
MKLPQSDILTIASQVNNMNYSRHVLMLSLLNGSEDIERGLWMNINLICLNRQCT